MKKTLLNSKLKIAVPQQHHLLFPYKINKKNENIFLCLHIFLLLCCALAADVLSSFLKRNNWGLYPFHSQP